MSGVAASVPVRASLAEVWDYYFDPAGWPAWVDEMDRLARASNATAIYAYGRPGWIRFWKSRGVAMHVTSEMLIRTL